MLDSVTAFYAGLLTLLYLFLALRVVRARYAHKQALGAKEDYPTLQRTVRAHGNFQEYAPLFLILLYLLESAGARGLCMALGAAFTLGRMSHAYSLLAHEPRGAARGAGFLATFGFRSLGMLLTFFPLGIAAIALLCHAF